MAKRPRMGRNLDALLGGSNRERTSKPVEAPDSQSAPASRPDAANVPDAAKPGVPEEASEPASHPVAGSVPGPNTSETIAGAGAADTSANDSAAVDPVPVQSSLLDEAPAASATTPVPPVQEAAGTTDRFRMVGVDQIRRGSYQPRRLFDQALLQELADSIKAEGLIQPIIVRPFAGAFELVAGERRWRAAQLAGISEIPAIIRDMPDQSVAAVSLIENIQRKDLNPLEEAAAFERLCDEFGMTHKAVAESVGRSRASVTNLMRLLELHDEVKVLVDKGELEMGHARAILGAPKDKQHGLAKDVIKRGLTVRAVEKLVRELVSESEGTPARKSGPVIDPDIERLSKKLGEKLGANVRIQHKATGKGKLEINYASVAELQGILAHIK